MVGSDENGSVGPRWRGRMSNRRLIATISLTIATALTAAACGSSASTNTPSPNPSESTIQTSIDSAAAALLPAKVKASGKLIVGVNVPYAPLEYLDNGDLKGFDIDLMNATAKALGLTVDWRQADFATIIPSVSAGTYDAGVSFGDTKARQEVVDFVDYLEEGILWAAPAGKTVDPTNACGLTVAVQSNTTESQTDLPALSKACTDANKPAIKMLQFASQDLVTNALILGRADAMSADSPITGYAVKQSDGKLVEAGPVRAAIPLAWPVAKNSTLSQSLQQALQSLMDDGTYKQIIDKWGFDADAITEAKINGGTS